MIRLVCDRGTLARRSYETEDERLRIIRNWQREKNGWESYGLTGLTILETKGAGHAGNTVRYMDATREADLSTEL